MKRSLRLTRLALLLSLVLVGLLTFQITQLTGSPSHPPQPTGPVTWQKNPYNPILQPSQAWEASAVGEQNVIIENGVWRMWYAAGGIHCAIGYAESDDGLHWRKDKNNPVIGMGRSGWDGIACRPSLTQDGERLYLYFVNGIGDGDAQLYVAESSDGVTWTTDSMPVLTGSDADGSIANTSVWHDARGWQMLYEARRDTDDVWQIGYARGQSATTWKSQIFPLTGLSRGGMYGGPQVIVTPQGYGLYFQAALSGVLPTDIYHATSPDAQHWKVDELPAIPRTQSWWEKDQTGDASIVEYNGRQWMFYGGSDNSDPVNVVGTIGVAWKSSPLP